MNTDTDKETPPCDCIEKCGKYWIQRCDCHNGTSLAEAEAWCRDANGADEFKAMREAIKEAHAALKNACAYPVCGGWNEQAEVALAKLKPFVSPEP